MAIALSTSLAQAANTPDYPPRTDNQIWVDGQLTMPVSPRMDVIGSGRARLGRGLNHLVYERGGVAFSYKLLSILAVSPTYDYVATQSIAGRDTREHRFGLDGTLMWQLRGFEFSDRNRTELRSLPTGRSLRYRNRLQIQHYLGLERLSLQISDEVFYDGALTAWSRNRFSIGLARQMHRTFSLGFYYLRQNDQFLKPGDINALGLNLMFQGRGWHR